MKKLQFLVLFLPILVYAQNNPCLNNTLDTSYTNITACDSYSWNDSTYNQSGTYYNNSSNNNNSINFNSNTNNYNLIGSMQTNAPYLEINGSDINNIFSGYNPFTVSLWIYGNAESFDSYGRHIIGKGYTGQGFGSNPSSFMLYKETYNVFSFILYSAANNYIRLQAIDLIDASSWSNIVLTYDGGGNTNSLKIYKNGVLQPVWGSTIVHGSYTGMSMNNDPLFIGARVMEGTLNTHLAWNGEMDDISIWDYTLSQSEITYNYQNCIDINSNGLAAYWNLEEGNGNTITDLSGNGNNGLLINNPLWNTNVPSQSCQRSRNTCNIHSRV